MSHPVTLRLYYALGCIVFLVFAISTKLYSGPGMLWARYYWGDIGIVAALYFALSAVWLRASITMRAGAIFTFAVAVEVFQGTGIPASWNLPSPWVHILGTSFDVTDFYAYAIGIGVAIICDALTIQRKKTDR